MKTVSLKNKVAIVTGGASDIEARDRDGSG